MIIFSLCHVQARGGNNLNFIGILINEQNSITQKDYVYRTISELAFVYGKLILL